MPAFIDLENQRFGKLVVLEYMPVTGKSTTWLCLCDCGRKTVTTSALLRKGKTKSCGCIRTSKKFASGVVAQRAFLASYKYAAAKRNLAFELTIDTFNQLITQNCYYCDAVPAQTLTHKHRHGGLICNGIDRLDNCLGYTVENCVACCKACNHAKHTHSVDEYIQRCIRIASKWGNK